MLLLAGCGTPQQAVPTGSIAVDLGRAVVAVADRQFGESCVAKPFGTRPAVVTSAADAQVIYAWTYCWTTVDGVRSTGLQPVVVTVASGTLQTTAEGDYARSIERLFPADVRTWAQDPPPLSGLVAEGDAEASAVPTPAPS